MTGIFAQYAPAYTGLGLEPRPVTVGTKQPPFKEWQKPDNQIDLEKRARWLTKYADLGIGLRTGSILPDQTKIGVLDIDRNDMVRLARALVGSTCERIGSKGSALFFRYPGNVRRGQIIRRELGTPDVLIGDLLVEGAFCVIPPTIHPKTGEAYRWVGEPLERYDLAGLPLIRSKSDLVAGGLEHGVSIELVFAALQSPHVGTLVTGTATHDAALGFTNDLLPYTQDVDLITLLVEAALPLNYEGNTLKEVPEFVRSGIAKGLHQPRAFDVSVYDPGDIGPIPLGYLRGEDFAFFDQGRRSVHGYSSNSLVTLGSLMALAPMSFWESRFPKFRDGEPAGVDGYRAGDVLIRLCKQRGGFNPSRVRGQGVYPGPGGTVIVNWGDKVPDDTRFVYMCHEPLDMSETGRPVDPAAVLAMFKRFNWANPSAAYLLLGWTIASVICGVLDWRPHVFLTGAKNTGKTTLVRALQDLLRPVVISLDGQSTEAGIRQSIGADSRPVMLDEFESDENVKRMKLVLKLMRSASSADNVIARGTPEGKAIEYSIRSTFLLAAINPIHVTPADRSRIVVLGLAKHQNDKGVAESIARDLEYVRGLGPSWCQFALSNIERVLENIATLQRVFPPCDSRHQLNISTLLAAAEAALRDGPLTEDQARQVIAQHRTIIDALAEAHESDDSQECLDALLQHRVRVDLGDVMLGWLLASVRKNREAGKDTHSTEAELEKYGIRWEEDGFLVANSHRGLFEVFDGTLWQTGNWGPSLKRLDGALPVKQRRYGGKPSLGTWIPASLIPERPPTSPDY